MILDSPRPAEALDMLSLITSYRVTQVIHVAARLGVADLLTDGDRDIEYLAERTRTHASSLYRVLRALAGLGIVREGKSRVFALTRLGQSLRSDVSGSMRAWAMMVGGEHHWDPWGRLIDTVHNGTPAFEHVFGKGPFQYYREHPDAEQIFQAALKGLTEVVNPAILDAYDFSAFRRIADIGGGTGRLIASLLQAHPGASGILFDQRDVIARAHPLIEEARLQGRCELIAGDFFSGVPCGADAYLLKQILHDWDDERSIAILRQCRQALTEQGRLLIIETVIPSGNGPFYGKLLDIEMLVSYPGRERTSDEYRALLIKAGLKLTRIARTSTFVSIIEAVVS